MKRVFIQLTILLLFTTVAFALPINECKIDIYFGNGVWNKQYSRDNCVNDTAAECSQSKLNEVIKREIIKNDPTLQAKYGEVKLAYNWGQGWDIDLVETFYQLKEAGQLSEWAFFALLDELLSKKATDIYGEDIETMRNMLLEAITKNEQANVDQMLQNYYDKSFSLGHRVLLVSHSQGNLFANRIYDSISPSGYKEYFANVQVASPANSVHAEKGTHITGKTDFIINPIPGSMEGNADLDFPGHSFVGAYLDSKDTYTKIVYAIKAQLKLLDNTPSQWKITETPKNCTDCAGYKVAVEHKFDPGIPQMDNVLPYDFENYKLYNIDGHYLLAPCGGKSIQFFDEIENNKICSKLIGTQKIIPKLKTLIDGVCIGVLESDIDYTFNEAEKELLIGTIGDNYWSGQCTNYKRHITLIVENSQNLKSFRVTEVGFDDWIQLSINNEAFYTSPYTLPPNCELSTSFITHPNIDIKSKIQEGLNRLNLHVIVTGGGEGWFKVQLQ